ncbi:MAG TPA: FHA domain-containing protein [Anaerolineae bacterium]|nr:FHA domain-containing protein [Anaerolineae bacterium]
MNDHDFRENPTPVPIPLEGEQSSALDRLLARRRWLIGLAVLGVVLVAISGAVLWIGLGGKGTPPPTPVQVSLPPSLDELMQQYPELADLLGDPALGSVYKDFIIAYESGGIEAARELARQRGMLNDRDEIRITLVVDQPEAVPAIVAELQKVGITVEGSYQDRINIGVPLSLIEQLAAQQGTDALFEQLTQMKHIIRLELPISRGTDSISLFQIEGEGVRVTGANAWHAAGITGKGIRVGVLDLGFDGYRALLGTELPPQVTAASFVYGKEPDGSGEVHGTACAEIVHEMAPDAELFLAYYDGSRVSEGQAVEWLLQQGVHIISNSTSGILGPMDGSDEAAQMVDDVASRGVLWVNSAGNNAQQHYRGQFTDSDGDGLHEFPDGKEIMPIGVYGDHVTVVLNWDDWQNVTEDYDLYLFDPNGDLIAGSEDTQNGSPGQMAAEGISARGLSQDIYYVAIKAHQTTRPAILDLYTMGAEVKFAVAEHSLGSPADARGAFTVGATEYRDDSLASYSSQGPSNDGRLKPEISAPAGVSGATYGPDGFDGTSASTPYVAGAAALVWSAFPDWTAAQVRDYLQSNALDLGPAGPDNGYGYGRLRLPPPSAVSAQPTQPPLPTLPPLPTALPEPTTVAALPAPEPEQPSPAEEETRQGLFLLLGGLGICGATVALASGLLLLVVWRASAGRQAAPPPPPPEMAAPPSPPPPPPPPADYGALLGVGPFPIPLRPGRITIGRSSDNDIVLDSRQISRHHARLECAAGRCTIEDLGSANGVIVNGQRVSRATLQPGDRVRLGDVTLTYRMADTAEADAWLEMGGTRYPIPAGGATIGRSSSNDILVNDALASRRHARLERRGGRFILTDLGSANGTFVNERRIRHKPLRDGDRIRIGRSQLIFHTRRRAA